MENVIEIYAEELMLIIDKALGQSLKSRGITIEDVKQKPNSLQHIIFPDGRQEWRWDGIRLVWLEPIKPPSFGVVIYGYKI